MDEHKNRQVLHISKNNSFHMLRHQRAVELFVDQDNLLHNR